MKKIDTLIMLHNLLEAYETVCAPICRDANMTQKCFDILLFLANNPEYGTASDISNIRAIKPNIVSFSVDKLVKDGYLERTAVLGDRRKIRLVPTPKAEAVIKRGQGVQQKFYGGLFAGFEENDLRKYFNYMERIRENITCIKKQTEEGKN